MSFKAKVTIPEKGIKLTKSQAEVKVISINSGKQEIDGKMKWVMTGKYIIYAHGFDSPITDGDLFNPNYNPDEGAIKQLYEIAKELPIFSEIEDI